MASWNTFSTIFLSLAAILQQGKADKRKQIQDIRLAVSKAFHSTEKYYELRASGQEQDSGVEIDIAQEWEAAAILIQEIDSNLANRLALKSRFWREGGSWSDEQIHNAGIELDRVRIEGMILTPNKSNKSV